jgi:predicted RNA methylase
VSAAIYPFRQVIGVEISEALQIVARQNIQRALPKLACKNIELVTCDAGEYELPDDVIVIYFFNPFFGPILSNVLQHVHDSFGRVPRNMVIICVAPGRKSAFSKEIAKHGWLTKTFECDFENGGYGAIYVARE